MDKPRTPRKTLIQARKIALNNGLRYVYTGNVHDFEGASTYCHNCNEMLIGRDWYNLSTWNVSTDNHSGFCHSCGTKVAGVFDGLPRDWGAKRKPVCIAATEGGNQIGKKYGFYIGPK